jgi:hypothetical protein
MGFMKKTKKAKLYEFFKGHRERWTRGTLARNKQGEEVTPLSRSAIRFCLIGATHKLYGDDRAVLDALRAEVARRDGSGWLVLLGAFNDHASFDELLDVIKSAGV